VSDKSGTKKTYVALGSTLSESFSTFSTSRHIFRYSDIYWVVFIEWAKAVRWIVVGGVKKALLWELPGMSALKLPAFWMV